MLLYELMTKQISIPCPGYNIEADWHEGATNKKIILAFVGFGSSKKSNFDFMAKLVDMTGMSALVVDFSGHGESPFGVDETVPAQHLLEATRAYDWIKANYPESTVHVMGTSYGGFMAAYLSRFRPIKKLILRTPAIYEPGSFYTEHRLIDKILVREYRKNTEALKNHPVFLQSPVSDVSTLLVVHGEDKSVPVETTDVYASAFDAQICVAEGFAHAFRDPANPQEGVPAYYDALASWLNQ
jgi:pimeloyl-ACP methyl ester carboxylesterase